MKELNIYREVKGLLEKGERITLATVIGTTGSTPAGSSAKMTVREDGLQIIGTIGGGCLEALVIEEARIAFHKGTQRLIEYQLNDEEIEGGLLCGGQVRILVEPLDVSFLSLFDQIVKMQDQGKNGILITHVQNGEKPEKTAVYDTEQSGSIIPDHIIHIAQSIAPLVIRSEKPQQINPRTGTDYFVEPILGYPTLFIFGGGHVSLSVAYFSKLAGFKVIVIDDREAFANRQRFPEADATIVDMYDSVFSKLEINPSSFIVIITRGHKYDELTLEHALKTPAQYIGMIGSKRKVLIALDRLQERGFPEEQLEKVFAPIGLDIGAQNPSEIGISIVSELIKVRRKGWSAPLIHMAETVRTIRKTKQERANSE